MRIDVFLAAAVLICGAAQMAIAAAPAQPRVTLSLSSEWEFLPAHDDEQIQKGDSYQWGTILVPAPWDNAKGLGPEWIVDPSKPDHNNKLNGLKYCWYRKRFRVDENLRGLNCLLRIVDVRWSAEVWLNGVRLGDHVGGYRPVEFDATSAIRPGEENVIVIKQGGGHTIPKYDDGVPKIPFGNKGWAQGASGIMGDIELKFFRNVTVSNVKIDPDIHNGAAQVTIRLTNHGKETQKVTVDYAAIERKSKLTASGGHTAFATIKAGDTSTISDTVKIGKPRLWSPENPFLYFLNVTARTESGACDHIEETFGMREFACKDGHFYLNGHRIYLRGATDLAIKAFPSSGTPTAIQTDRKWIRKYLGPDARGMNANVLRTHMGPWYKPFYDIADECGTMLVAEMPNWPPEGGPTYYERPGYAEKLYSEMELIAAELWNHPSVIIWSAVNEPYNWDYSEHENKVLVPFFKKLDPTRPVMRAGAVSEDIADVHNYEGFWTGTVGDHIRVANYVKDHNPGKPLCDTEYLETAVKQFAKPEWPRAQKWMGYNVTLKRAEFTHALFAMEETEVKRRLQYDGLLPFWYGMFMTKGKSLGDEKWDTYYALRNSFAPLAVSVDLVDRHFTTGSELKLPVWAMNDLEKGKKGKISVCVLKEDPPYIITGPPATPIWTKTLQVDIPPFSATPHEVTVPLPAEEGSYWLYATLEVKGRETVMSKRPVHVLDRSASTAGVKIKKIAVIENGTALADRAKSAGVEVRPYQECDVLVIGQNALASASGQMDEIRKWVESGGRLVILDQEEWPEGLFGMKLEKDRDVSYLFKEKGHENDAIWLGIADAYMENWNGSGAEGLTSFFPKETHFSPKAPGGETLAIGSSGQEGLNARALLRLKMGKGEVLACQIRIAERLAKGAEFDPVAERLMVNLIGVGSGR